MPRSFSSNLLFTDLHPEPADFYTEITRGLRETQKYIPPKFFYDERGSRIFDRICETAEYYPTRTELRIILENLDDIVDTLGQGCCLMEPGSGSSQKVRLLLEALQPTAYIPIEISGQYLVHVAEQLCLEFPWLEVHAICADFTQQLMIPEHVRDTRKIAFFPGSTIGNFEPEQALCFLKDIHDCVEPNGGLLIGVDCKKDRSILHAAYNDAEGATADFNLNLLTRINRELGATFNPARFHHKAFYNEARNRIEMHLISNDDQVVTIDREAFFFAEGESIHTENSYKYSTLEFQALAAKAGFKAKKTWMDPDHLFALYYFDAV